MSNENHDANCSRKKVAEISKGRKLIPADSETIIHEDGPSSESVTNSTGPPQDYESSDTSLKLG